MVMLTRGTYKQLAIAKVFPKRTKPLNSLDFTEDGKYCAFAGDDEQLTVYDCETGTQHKLLHAKKYGIDQVRFTHNQDNVLCGTKDYHDATVRLWCINNNSYLRYFKGHTMPVTSLSVNPVAGKEEFLSVSLDNSLRMWDMRSPSCQGMIKLPTSEVRPMVAHDPKTTQVFAVAMGDNMIKFFDDRQLEKGCFSTIRVNDPENRSQHNWSSFKFSRDGSEVLASVVDRRVYVLNAMASEDQNCITKSFAVENDEGLMLESSFSPDGNFVLSGSQDCSINVWDKATGTLECTLQGHGAPVRLVQFNPSLLLLASGCHTPAFWLPRS